MALSPTDSIFFKSVLVFVLDGLGVDDQQRPTVEAGLETIGAGLETMGDGLKSLPIGFVGIGATSTPTSGIKDWK